MVQKQEPAISGDEAGFESSVVLDGTKTVKLLKYSLAKFESSVVLDGTKTLNICITVGLSLRVVLF